MKHHASKKQKRGKGGKKLSDEQEQFVLALWRKKPASINEIRKIDEVAYSVLVIFYGLGRKKPLKNCEAIRRMLAQKNIILTQSQVHGLKYVGLCLLGWAHEHHQADLKYQKQADELLESYRQKTKQGETKMTPQEECAKVKAMLFEKSEEGADFGNDLARVDQAWEMQTGVWKPLCLSVIYGRIITHGTFVDIAEGLGISMEDVVKAAGVVFCFAYPERISDMTRDIQTLYLKIKSVYDKAQAAQADISQGEPEEASTESNGPKYYGLVLMEERIEGGLLILKMLPPDFSKPFVVQRRDVATVEEFSIHSLPSLEIKDGDLKELQYRLKDDSKIIYLESQEGLFDADFYCLLDKKS